MAKLSTTRNFRVVQKEGNRDVEREMQFYNLDAIIAVGYRVNSKQTTQFRRWATETLKQYIIKGSIKEKMPIIVFLSVFLFISQMA
ncbi:RhuM family protein [Candidatus Bathycorpusculum sp.]|uniref:RhuM family protein n=1 Tax=Candidatus Bathycorpusculum sp. TaxID=2994959 RepID=UPI00281C4A19|nr:virulence RhuM family protein [Candidatus Termitimicrobium sp.]MCL2432395.1 virulence RhuM family protein [Candidatus Termitimicrobium sp.]